MCGCACEVLPVKNPAQLALGFLDTRFPDSYNDGFKSGVTWDASWMPGGPWVFTHRDNGFSPKNEKWALMAEESQYKHDRWHEGFKAGLELRLRTDHLFAAWFRCAKGPGHHRYHEPECTVAPRPE